MTETIRHVVMWRVTGETPDERSANRHKVKAAFEGLRDRIAGLISVEVGLDFSNTGHAFDVVLVTQFASRAALAAYAVDPEHLRVREALSGVRSTACQVDYVVDEHSLIDNMPLPPSVMTRGVAAIDGVRAIR